MAHMPKRPHEAWLLELLEVRPGDAILEVGFGSTLVVLGAKGDIEPRSLSLGRHTRPYRVSLRRVTPSQIR
jgi:hypothetical protein